MKNNRALLLSAFLAASTAVVHAIGGTIEIHSALLNSSLPESIRFLLYACWHLVTVTLVFSAISLFWSARYDRVVSNLALPAFIGIFWVAFGAVFVFVALYFLGVRALIILPQWTLLLPIGSFVLFCVRNEVHKRGGSY